MQIDGRHAKHVFSLLSRELDWSGIFLVAQHHGQILWLSERFQAWDRDKSHRTSLAQLWFQFGRTLCFTPKTGYFLFGKACSESIDQVDLDLGPQSFKCKSICAQIAWTGYQRCHHPLCVIDSRSDFQ